MMSPSVLDISPQFLTSTPFLRLPVELYWEIADELITKNSTNGQDLYRLRQLSLLRRSCKHLYVALSARQYRQVQLPVHLAPRFLSQLRRETQVASWIRCIVFLYDDNRLGFVPQQYPDEASSVATAVILARSSAEARILDECSKLRDVGLHDLTTVVVRRVEGDLHHCRSWSDTRHSQKDQHPVHVLDVFLRPPKVVTLRRQFIESYDWVSSAVPKSIADDIDFCASLTFLSLSICGDEGVYESDDEVDLDTPRRNQRLFESLVGLESLNVSIDLSSHRPKRFLSTLVEAIADTANFLRNLRALRIKPYFEEQSWERTCWRTHHESLHLGELLEKISRFQRLESLTVPLPRHSHEETVSALTLPSTLRSLHFLHNEVWSNDCPSRNDLTDALRQLGTYTTAPHNLVSTKCTLIISFSTVAPQLGAHHWGTTTICEIESILDDLAEARDLRRAETVFRDELDFCFGERLLQGNDAHPASDRPRTAMTYTELEVFNVQDFCNTMY